MEKTNEKGLGRRKEEESSQRRRNNEGLRLSTRTVPAARPSRAPLAGSCTQRSVWALSHGPRTVSCSAGLGGRPWLASANWFGGVVFFFLSSLIKVVC